MLQEHGQKASACLDALRKLPRFPRFSFDQSVSALEATQKASYQELLASEHAQRASLQRDAQTSKTRAQLLYHRNCIAALEIDPLPRREAGATTYVCTDDDFEVHTHSSAEQKIAALLEKSARDIEAHKVVGSLMNEYCDRSQQVLEGAGKKAKRVARTCESAIAGSVKAKISTAAAVMFYHNQTRGCVALPTGSAGTRNLGTLLITHRHYYEVPGGIAVDSPIRVGSTVGYVAYPNQSALPLTGTVHSVFSPEGQDVMYLYTDIHPSGLSKFTFGKPKVGTPVTIKTGAVVGRTDDGLVQVSWSEAMGVVKSTSDQITHYDATTAHGDCGFPVFAADGSIIALHTLGNDTYDGKQRANAGERLFNRPYPKRGESVLPRFDPDPIGPSLQGRVTRPGKPDAFQDLSQFRMVEKMSYNGLRQDKNLTGLMPQHHWAKPSTLLNHLEARKYADEVDYKFDHKLYKQPSWPPCSMTGSTTFPLHLWRPQPIQSG